jgi:hypothetical protein
MFTKRFYRASYVREGDFLLLGGGSGEGEGEGEGLPSMGL